MTMSRSSSNFDPMATPTSICCFMGRSSSVPTMLSRFSA
jgi:hypothetical protein